MTGPVVRLNTAGGRTSHIATSQTPSMSARDSSVLSMPQDASRKNDAMAKPLYGWDAKGNRFHTVYDILHRPERQEVLKPAAAVVGIDGGAFHEIEQIRLTLAHLRRLFDDHALLLLVRAAGRGRLKLEFIQRCDRGDTHRRPRESQRSSLILARDVE